MVIKPVMYWVVKLYRGDGIKPSAVSGIMQLQRLEEPFFVGFSKAKPRLNIPDDDFVELFLSEHSPEARQIRRSLIGFAELIPIYKPEDEDKEKAKADGSEERPATFEDAARPLMKWLAENVHPHHTAIVDQSSAELLMGLQREVTQEYVKD